MGKVKKPGVLSGIFVFPLTADDSDLPFYMSGRIW